MLDDLALERKVISIEQERILNKVRAQVIKASGQKAFDSLVPRERAPSEAEIEAVRGIIRQAAEAFEFDGARSAEVGKSEFEAECETIGREMGLPAEASQVMRVAKERLTARLVALDEMLGFQE